MILKARDFVLDCSSPLVMGILNITPDSFFDGGFFFKNENSIDEDAVMERARQMVKEGADILDVGAESTRPNAEQITEQEEKRRILGVVQKLVNEVDVPISIDTYKSTVAEAALSLGASMINDVTAFREDALMPAVIAKHGAAVVLMHSLQKPQAMAWSFDEKTRYEGSVVESVKAHLAEVRDVARTNKIEHVVLDVGFGFGKSVEDNFLLLKNLDVFLDLNCPLLVGLSRKSFIGKAISSHDVIPPPEQRFAGTMAAHTIAIMNGANMLRVHDVKATKEVIRLCQMVGAG